jgi:inorganic pyrophosphatase/exopolyphosphatase
MSKIYVIDHVNPDTGAIGSAMGYAWLSNSQNDVEAVAARGIVSRKKQLLPVVLVLLEE